MILAANSKQRKSVLILRPISPLPWFGAGWETAGGRSTFHPWVRTEARPVRWPQFFVATVSGCLAIHCRILRTVCTGLCHRGRSPASELFELATKVLGPRSLPIASPVFWSRIPFRDFWRVRTDLAGTTRRVLPLVEPFFRCCRKRRLLFCICP